MIERFFCLDREEALNLNPPAPRFEPPPEPRPGFIWIQGYWDWQASHHVWVCGRWDFERCGYRWLPHRWVERQGRWYLQQGGWTRNSELETLNGPGEPRRRVQIGRMAAALQR